MSWTRKQMTGKPRCHIMDEDMSFRLLAVGMNTLSAYDRGPTFLAYGPCQLRSLLHSCHSSMQRLNTFQFEENVRFINGCLVNDTNTSKLPQTADQNLAHVSVGLVRHSATCFHVHMVHNATNLAQQCPGLHQDDIADSFELSICLEQDVTVICCSFTSKPTSLGPMCFLTPAARAA